MSVTEHVLTPLCELARKYGTDKGGWHKARGSCHNYTPTYHELFKDRRAQVRDVLEIGIGHGASLRMWEEYFPNAAIVGIDNNRDTLLRRDENNRIVCLLVDQINGPALDLQLAGHQFDLIVDDGSHVTEHQIFTANHLRKHLKPDGFYAIEDIFEDCKPRTVLNHIQWGEWTAVPVGIGLGGAHCECGCRGGEVLLVGRLPCP